MEAPHNEMPTLYQHLFIVVKNLQNTLLEAILCEYIQPRLDNCSQKKN